VSINFIGKFSPQFDCRVFIAFLGGGGKNVLEIFSSFLKKSGLISAVWLAG
jgi:hypothetical protein